MYVHIAHFILVSLYCADISKIEESVSLPMLRYSKDYHNYAHMDTSSHDVLFPAGNL